MTRSYYESIARARIAGLLDADSFHEWLSAADRVTSPHLAILEQPAAFDDGVIIGQGSIAGKQHIHRRTGRRLHGRGGG